MYTMFISLHLSVIYHRQNIILVRFSDMRNTISHIIVVEQKFSNSNIEHVGFYFLALIYGSRFVFTHRQTQIIIIR